MAVKVAQQGFNESKQPDLGAQDIRFTSKGKSMFAFLQGWPQGEVVIHSLAINGPQQPDKVTAVRMLGRDENF